MALHEKQLQLIDWLTDPNRQGTHKDFARTIETTPETVYRWKKLPEFRAEWDKRLVELNIRPDRVQAVVEELWKAASNPGRDQVKAAQLYLAFVDRYSPKITLVHDKRALAEITDEELDAMLAAAAGEEMAQRAILATPSSGGAYNTSE